MQAGHFPRNYAGAPLMYLYWWLYSFSFDLYLYNWIILVQFVLVTLSFAFFSLLRCTNALFGGVIDLIVCQCAVFAEDLSSVLHQPIRKEYMLFATAR